MSLAVLAPEILNIIKADLYICLNVVMKQQLKREALSQQQLLHSFRLTAAFGITRPESGSWHTADREGQVMQGEIPAQVQSATLLNGCLPQTGDVLV